MTFGITTQGFVLKTLAEIEDELETALKAAFGANINTTPQSVFGQLKSIFAEREALLWELAQEIYNSQYPALAGDISLDHAASITGHVRLPALASQISGQQLTGTAGTEIPAGTLFSVDGNPDIIFETDEDVEIGSGGTATVDCTCRETGPIDVDAGTLTQIDTPISGLSSVINPSAAIPGQDLETDAELRLRRNNTLQISHSGPAAAIRSAILTLNEDASKVQIEHVSVFENYTMSVDARGLPAKSFEVVVYQAGGVTDRDQEIADMITLSAKPAGIEAHGDVSKNVTDSQGFTHVCKFSRPTIVPIYLELDLTIDSNYPAAGDTAAQEAISDWGNSLGAGADVIVYPQLIAQLSGISGITDVTVRIGRSASPTLDSNITIDDGSSGTVEMSSWSTANITVSSS